MSTKQHQALVDAMANAKAAEDRLRAARADFVKHISATGVAVRKHFQSKFSQSSLLAISTKRADDNVSMNLSIVWNNAEDEALTDDIRNWIRDQGWRIEQTHPLETTKHHFVRTFTCK